MILPRCLAPTHDSAASVLLSVSYFCTESMIASSRFRFALVVAACIGMSPLTGFLIEIGPPSMRGWSCKRRFTRDPPYCGICRLRCSLFRQRSCFQMKRAHLACAFGVTTFQVGIVHNFGCDCSRKRAQKWRAWRAVPPQPTGGFACAVCSESRLARSF